MKITETGFEGLSVIENFNAFDDRGLFVKTFNDNLFRQHGISFTPKEIYYSLSKKNVIRGMHFQIPPHDHAKLIYVISGAILDVVIDIRRSSGTYGKYFEIILRENDYSLFIPSGFAHGFKSLQDNSIVVYNQTSCYSREHDTGILWDSFGFNWGDESFVLAERDKSFLPFNKFQSPF